jgi:hypothetical protein
MQSTMCFRWAILIRAQKFNVQSRFASAQSFAVFATAATLLANVMFVYQAEYQDALTAVLLVPQAVSE